MYAARKFLGGEIEHAHQKRSLQPGGCPRALGFTFPDVSPEWSAQNSVFDPVSYDGLTVEGSDDEAYHSALDGVCGNGLFSGFGDDKYGV
jgi:hypothetical protein